MGFFSSDNYSAEQIKQTIRPTLDIAYSAIEAYEKIDKPPRSGIIGMALLESEYAVLNELQNIDSLGIQSLSNHLKMKQMSMKLV